MDTCILIYANKRKVICLFIFMRHGNLVMLGVSIFITNIFFCFFWFYSSVKMDNQLHAGVHIASRAEAMAFGAPLGINTGMLFDVITKSGGTSWDATLYCPSYDCLNLRFNLGLI